MELTKIRILRKPLFYGTYALIMRVFLLFQHFLQPEQFAKKGNVPIFQ